jgi:hypothetical protein
MIATSQPSKARIIVAMPPKQFFGGNDRHNAEELLASLRKFYPNVFVFDVGIYVGDSAAEADSLIADAKAFNADLAIGLPNASYCMMLDEKRRRQRYEPEPTRFDMALRWLKGTTPENVFADVLNVPTVLLWDHIITQPGYLIFGWLPYSVSASKFGAINRLRRGLDNPRFRHFVPDSGHITALEDLGIVPKHIRRYVVPAHTAFLTDEPVSDGRNTNAILFAGNLNADGRDQFEISERALVAELNYEMIISKRSNWAASSWKLLRNATEARAGRVPALAPDNTFFWSLANSLLSNLTTAHRKEVLGRTPLPIAYYGGFADPQHARTYDGAGHIVHRGSVPFDDLPQLYRSYRLSVDVTNCPFINGSNAKVLDCFASGGYMLVDWRQDLAEELGEDIASTFMYRDREELTALSDKVIGNAKLRAEVIATMRSKIGRSLTFSHLLRDTIEQTLGTA